MQTCTLLANAKVNLSLEVVGKREDGYHLLETVMQSISLHDVITLTVTKQPNITLTCTEPAIPCDEGNIAYKAAKLFLEETNCHWGVQIHIEKHIPSEAGLGGGSADGAAVLVGLNHLLSANCSTEKLCQLGLQIGADVPFCIVGGTAFCEGIGEQITPLPPMPPCYLVVCKPPCGVSTKAAYQQIDALPQRTLYEKDTMLQALAQSSLPKAASGLYNIFTQSVSLPEVTELCTSLKESGAIGAAMSGSGSAVYGIFAEEISAKACADKLRQTYPQTYLTTPTRQGVMVQT